MLIVGRNGLVSPSSKFNSIVSDLQSKVNKLDGLAAKEEVKAAKFLERHVASTSVVAKARSTSEKINSLLG